MISEDTGQYLTLQTEPTEDGVHVVAAVVVVVAAAEIAGGEKIAALAVVEVVKAAVDLAADTVASTAPDLTVEKILGQPYTWMDGYHEIAPRRIAETALGFPAPRQQPLILA